MFKHRALRIAIAAAALLSVAVSVSAQSSKWADPYQKGQKAYQAKKWEEVVADMEQAVAADPKAESRKYVEGVFRIDYFRYAYLAAAYTELGQCAKAQAALEKAKSPSPNDKNLQATLVAYTPRVANCGPAKPTINPAFLAALQLADAAFTAKKYSDALAQYDAAKTADLAEFGKQNIQAKRDEAARDYALQLDGEGRNALGDSLSTARARFNQAEQVSPGLKDNVDGLAEVKKREDQYAQLKASAEQDIAAKRYQPALDKFNQAKSANSEQFTLDNLMARVTFVTGQMNQKPIVPPPPVNNVNSGNNGTNVNNVNVGGQSNNLASTGIEDAKKLFAQGKTLASQGKYPDAETIYASALTKDPNNADAKTALEASKHYAELVSDGRAMRDKKGSETAARAKFEEARGLDADRFNRDGLQPVLDALLKQSGTDPAKESLRLGLLALLKGDAQASVSILQPALNQKVTGSTAASLHAYLGVAYATRALSSAKQDDQSNFNKIAVEQFKMALAAESGYQLSQRLVSPKILALYDQARR